MEFYDVIRTRRSVRRYSDRDVPGEVLERVLDAARLAPSANNKQPWRYIIVREQPRREEIARIAANQTFIAQAPVVIVLCAQQYVDHNSWIGENMYLVDATISMDHLVLAARNEGLGTCWIGAFDRKGVEEMFGLPGDVHPIVLTPLGYPASDGAFGEDTVRKSLDAVYVDDVPPDSDLHATAVYKSLPES
jgi:nitroreductase